MLTPVLYHGPTARDRALERAEEVGRMISEPIGDKGLRVEDSRTIVNLALNPGVGDRPPSLMVGPLDLATPEAADALLKTLEEVSKTSLRLVLWTDYLKEVIPTIRSRCLVTWCPPGKTWLDPLSYMDGPAKDLERAWASKDWAKVMSLVEESGKAWPDLLKVFCSNLSKRVEDPEALRSWERIRPALDGKGSLLVAIDALLPENL